MTDQIEMPANCERCGGLWDLNSLNHQMLCPPCVREEAASDLDEEDECELVHFVAAPADESGW